MKLDKDKYLQHIRDDEEKITMRRVLDLIEMAINKFTLVHTNFLDPNLVELSKSILKRFDEIEYKVFGGFDNAERNVVFINNVHSFYDEDETNPLRALQIELNTEKITHRDVLGSVLGLGITRDKVGDIHIKEGEIKIVLLEDIADYVKYNLEKVKRENVKIYDIPLSELGSIEELGTSQNIIVASLRLDAVISEVYNLSRDTTQKLIKSEFVKVNHAVEDKTHHQVDAGNLISVRGKGRFKIVSLDGYTKKNRIKMAIFRPE